MTLTKSYFPILDMSNECSKGVVRKKKFSHWTLLILSSLKWSVVQTGLTPEVTPELTPGVTQQTPVNTLPSTLSVLRWRATCLILFFSIVLIKSNFLTKCFCISQFAPQVEVYYCNISIIPIVCRHQWIQVSMSVCQWWQHCTDPAHRQCSTRWSVEYAPQHCQCVSAQWPNY